jgi:hypothetical protein
VIDMPIRLTRDEALKLAVLLDHVFEEPTLSPKYKSHRVKEAWVGHCRCGFRTRPAISAEYVNSEVQRHILHEVATRAINWPGGEAALRVYIHSSPDPTLFPPLHQASALAPR